MILRTFFETSITAFLLRTMYGCYSYLKRKMIEIYHKSKICHLTNRFKEILHISFGFSIFKMVFNILSNHFKKENPSLYYNSKFVQGIANSYKRLRMGIANYLSTSLIENWVKNIKGEFSLYSQKAIGAILISAAIVNLILSIIFRHELGASGLVISGIFIIIAAIRLLSDVDWAAIRNHSFIFRVLFR